MKKPLSFIIALYVLSLTVPASATGVLRNLRDDKDNACVIDCLDASRQCSAEDRIRCQRDCRRPSDVNLVIGGQVVQADEDPAKEYQMVQDLQARMGLDPRKYEAVVVTYDVNPLSDLGVNLPISQYITFVPFGSNLPEGLGVTSVLYTDKISCTYPKNRPLPFGGGFGEGCRETAAYGTGGWAAQGCAAANGCCVKPGTNGESGYGVCTVNSTAPGDGIY